MSETTIDPEASTVQESHPTPDTFSLPGRKTHFLFSSTHDSKDQNFTDQTVRLLVDSKYCHYYMLVLYDCDSNYIHAETMPARHAKSTLAYYQRFIAILIKSVLQPKMKRLDNECSLILQQFMDTQDIELN